MEVQRCSARGMLRDRAFMVTLQGLAESCISYVFPLVFENTQLSAGKIVDQCAGHWGKSDLSNTVVWRMTLGAIRATQEKAKSSRLEQRRGVTSMGSTPGAGFGILAREEQTAAPIHHGSGPSSSPAPLVFFYPVRLPISVSISRDSSVPYPT